MRLLLSSVPCWSKICNGLWWDFSFAKEIVLICDLDYSISRMAFKCNQEVRIFGFLFPGGFWTLAEIFFEDQMCCLLALCSSEICSDTLVQLTRQKAKCESKQKYQARKGECWYAALVLVCSIWAVGCDRNHLRSTTVLLIYFGSLSSLDNLPEIA